MLEESEVQEMSETNAKARKTRGPYSDLSLWALIASNLIVIVWALLEGWSLAIIMWVYWSQSVFIGIFWFFKMLAIKDWFPDEFTINGRTVDLNKGTKSKWIMFFFVHYGGFQVVHAMLLRHAFKSMPIFQILTPAGIFLAYQSFSFIYNRKWQAKREAKSEEVMMLFPYARVVPMHLTMCIALSDWGQRQSLMLFLSLKLLADAVMHIFERVGFTDVRKNCNSPVESKRQGDL